jgi:hypothetical protein
MVQRTCGIPPELLAKVCRALTGNSGPERTSNFVYAVGWTQPMHTGQAGKLLRAAELLTSTGALGAALLGRRRRAVAAVSGLALLAGSAATRFGIFQAGVASARDPKYTVRPQRERLDSRPHGDAGPVQATGAVT